MQCMLYVCFVASLDSKAQTGNATSGDWQEEIYQKIKVMKEAYLAKLTEMDQKIAGKLQQDIAVPMRILTRKHSGYVEVKNVPGCFGRVPTVYYRAACSKLRKEQKAPWHDSLPQQPKNEQLEKLKFIKTMSERFLKFLQVPKSSILPNFKEKVGAYEKLIFNFLNSSRPQKLASLQQGQGQQNPPPHIQSMQQSQQSQSHITQAHPIHENHMNPQLQSMNLQGSSVATVQQNNVTSLQHNSLSALSGVSTTSQSMISSLQAGSTIDLGQGSALSASQDVPVGSLQQNHQHYSVDQCSEYHHQQLNSGAQFPISSSQLLQAASPQMPQHPSPQIDQQNLLTFLAKAGTPLQSTSSPFVVPSPSTPIAPSPISVESEKVNSGISALLDAGTNAYEQAAGAVTRGQSLSIGTPGISASPLLAEFICLDGNHVSDIDSVISTMDTIAGSARGNGSRTAVGEDLAAMTKWHLQARNMSTQDTNIGARKMRRYTSAMPLNVVSSAGSANYSFKHLTCSETSDSESTATSSVKRPRFQANHTLLEEIVEINQRLIDTVVCVSDEDVDPTPADAITGEGGEGTIVLCSFSAVALCSNFKSQYASAQMVSSKSLRSFVSYHQFSPYGCLFLPVTQVPLQSCWTSFQLKLGEKIQYCRSFHD
ncbi:hypothetical protein C3L33_05061, partial [Rhododendron williamsianum]